MKKRTAAWIVMAALVTALTACGSKATEESATKEAAKETVKTEAAEAITAAETKSDISETEKEKGEAEQKDKETEAKEVLSEATVTLAAAASLEYAFTEKIIPAFEAANPNVKIEGTYDSSGKLQTQIESGLSADIFFSAASKQMNALLEQGLVQADTVNDLLENKIVLILPEGSEQDAAKFEDIASFDMIAIGDPASVPVGQYAEEALKTLGLWESVSEKVSLGTNVTEVLNWVAEGSADCGIVYATDAATTDRVKVVAEAPEGSLKTPVLYPVAQMELTKEKDEAVQKAAKAFFDYICSEEAASVFAEYGFSVNQ